MAQTPKSHAKLRDLKSVFCDPGIVLAIGNTFLFGQNGKLSFLIIFLASLVIFLSKSVSLMPNSYKLKTRLPQREYFGLEIMGYACILSAILAIAQRSVYGVICGLCFGYANLILANRFETGKKDTSTEIHTPKNIDTPILTYWLLALIKEPIVLIAIGMIHSGLSGGGESLWGIPVMILAPMLILFRPTLNRAQPQCLFAIGSLWYTIVAAANKNFLAMFANGCFTIAFLLMAWHENNLYKAHKR